MILFAKYWATAVLVWNRAVRRSTDIFCRSRKTPADKIMKNYFNELLVMEKLSWMIWSYHKVYSRFHETLATNVPNFVAKFASSLQNLEVHIRIHKPICKQSPWLVTEVEEANQMHSLQTGMWISSWTFELRNKLANFATKFGTFVAKVSWNRL